MQTPRTNNHSSLLDFAHTVGQDFFHMFTRLCHCPESSMNTNFHAILMCPNLYFDRVLKSEEDYHQGQWPDPFWSHYRDVRLSYNYLAGGYIYRKTMELQAEFTMMARVRFPATANGVHTRASVTDLLDRHQQETGLSLDNIMRALSGHMQRQYPEFIADPTRIAAQLPDSAIEYSLGHSSLEAFAPS